MKSVGKANSDYFENGHSIEKAEFVRRCGKIVPRYVPESSREDPQPLSFAERLKLYHEIMHGLSRIQRQTFILLLLGWQPEEIAHWFAISRPAIYYRIRGRDGNGGLVGANDYASYWWRHKNKVNQHK